MKNIQQIPKLLDSVKDSVQEILTVVPDARDSDSLLYLLLLEKAGVNSMKLTVWDMLTNAKEYPHFETVRRARQMLQEKNPELRASGTVQAFRQTNEIAVRNWVQNN